MNDFLKKLCAFLVLVVYSSGGIAFESFRIGMSSLNSQDKIFKLKYDKFEDLSRWVVEANSGKTYFSLYRNGVLIEYRIESSLILKDRWKLSEWKNIYTSREVGLQFEDEGLKKYPPLYGRSPVDHEIGCIFDHPLRYGDLEKDGEAEVLILLDGRMTLFSPQTGEIVFSEFIDESTAMSREDMNKIRKKNEYDIPYHFISQLMGPVMAAAPPGIRAYSKVFAGDYDENGQFDLIVWRKEFISNRMEEEEGFKKYKDVFRHYEKAEGGTQYLLKGTGRNTIRDWLADKALVWRSGYPAKSECKGSSDQLIPEMHSPLLNDPDVLE